MRQHGEDSEEGSPSVNLYTSRDEYFASELSLGNELTAAHV